jgi:hypothetical protein
MDQPTPRYAGYLAPFLDHIVDGHRRGLGSIEIAAKLYAAGARASTSDGRELSPQHHIGNIAAMVHFILLRLGLRTRKPRGKRLTARRGDDGVFEVM